MKPAPFTYHRPDHRDEVDALLSQHGSAAKLLAGGQSLMPILNMRLAAPDHIVDLNGLQAEPSAPVIVDDVLIIEPLVRQATALNSLLVNEQMPLLAEALGYVGHAPIRTRGTIVGSVAHADPAAELPALMVALDAVARVRRAAGARSVPVSELLVGPLTTSLADDEWIEQLRLALPRQRGGSAVEEFARRHGDFAICGVFALASYGGSAEIKLTLTYFGVGELPQKVELSSAPDADLYEPVAQAASVLDVSDDVHATAEYRRFLAVGLGVAAGRRALERMEDA